jgi:hypothetical protein
MTDEHQSKIFLTAQAVPEHYGNCSYMPITRGFADADFPSGSFSRSCSFGQSRQAEAHEAAPRSRQNHDPKSARAAQ